MADSVGKAIHIKPVLTPAIRHPIKAARLLYSTPAYILRAPIYLIFLIMFAGLLYSFWAKKDILVMAPLVLERESFTIEAIGGGMVSKIIAKSNSVVRSGDPLFTVQEQVRVSMTPEQEMLETRKFELRRELDKIKDEYEHRLSQLELDLIDITTGGETSKRSMQGRIRQIQEQLATADRAKRRQAGRLNMARTQFNRKKALFNQRDITVTEYERALESVNEAEKAYDDARARIEEVKISLQIARDELGKVSAKHIKEKIEKEISQLKQRQQRDIQRLGGQITGIENKLKAGQDLVEFVEYKDNLAEYKSDFDGLITKIHVKNGQMIGAGTPTVTIIKDTSVLQGHAFVDNKDIGHLKRGQAVKIKYFAYPYQEYGIATGLISSIAKTASSLPGKESKYLVVVALRNYAVSRRGGSDKPLEIGLEGFAEIKTGEKRFIELVFTPISKFFTPEEE